MNEITMTNGFAELSVNEMEEITGGGFPWGEVVKAAIDLAKVHPYATVAVLGCAGAVACWGAGQSVGEDIGELIYNWTH